MDQNSQSASPPVPSKRTEARVESTGEIRQSGAASEKRTDNTDTANLGIIEGADTGQNQLLPQGTSQESASREAWISAIIFAFEIVIFAIALSRYGNFYLQHVQELKVKMTGVGIVGNFLTNVSLIFVALGTVNTAIDGLLGPDFSKNHPTWSSVFRYWGILLGLFGAVIALAPAFLL